MDASNERREPRAWRHPGGKLLRAGPQALSEAELLAVIISAGTRQKSAERLGEEIIEAFRSLEALSAAPLDELKGFKGLGQVKLCRIAAALEIARRLRTR
jgi:DNA repair protein RadC